MPKSITSELLADIGSDVTTLATLIKIRRQDNTTYYITDHVEDIVYDGDTYDSSIRCTISAVSTSSDLAVDNMDITLYLDGVIFKNLDFTAGAFKHSEIDVSIIDYISPDHGVITVRRGWAGETLLNQQGVANITISGIKKLLDIEIGRVYQPSCDTDLGSPRCGVAIDYDQQYSYLNNHFIGTSQYILSNTIDIPVVNHSFESEVAHDETIPGWTRSSFNHFQTTEFEALNNVTPQSGITDGTHYLFFGAAQGRPVSPDGSQFVYQDIDLSSVVGLQQLVSDDKVMFNLRIDIVNTLYLLDLWSIALQFLDSDGKVIFEKDTGFKANDEPDIWRTTSLTAKAPSNCVTVRIVINGKITDGVIFNVGADNVRLSYWDATTTDPTGGILYRAARLVDLVGLEHKKNITNSSFDISSDNSVNTNTDGDIAGWEHPSANDYWSVLDVGSLPIFQGNRSLFGGDDGSGTQSSYKLDQWVEITTGDWALDPTRIDLGYYFGQFSIYKGHNDTETSGMFDIAWYAADKTTLIRLDANAEEIGALNWSQITTTFSVPTGARWCKLTLKCTSPVGSSDASNIAFDAAEFKCFDTQIASKKDPITSQGIKGTTFDPSIGSITLDGNIVWKAAESFVRHDVVSGVASRKEFTATTMVGVDGQYETGVIKWLTGDNVGYSSVIRTWDKDTKTIKTYFKTINDIQIGDSFLYVRPCHKRFTEDCILTFDNAINFQGFPHLPGALTE